MGNSILEIEVVSRLNQAAHPFNGWKMLGYFADILKNYKKGNPTRKITQEMAEVIYNKSVAVRWIIFDGVETDSPLAQEMSSLFVKFQTDPQSLEELDKVCTDANKLQNFLQGLHNRFKTAASKM